MVSDYDLRNIVKNSLSLSEVLMSMNLAPAGGNYTILNKRIAKLNIDTSHFIRAFPSGHNKRIATEDLLKNGIKTSSHRLRLRLLNEGYKTHKCENCNNTEWMGSQIPLELDHIDGNNLNNELSNLRLLCPNCHALTPTYRGKNISKIREIKKYFCKCGEEKRKNSDKCKQCFNNLKSNHVPSKDLIHNSFIKHNGNYTKMSKDFGKSDVTIKKWCLKYKII